MNNPKTSPSVRNLLNLPDLPKHEQAAIFEEPWHAEIFSIVHMLLDQDIFLSGEWAMALGSVIQKNGPTVPYYESWLSALEQLSIDKQLVSMKELSQRRDAWDKAARATPHGEAIEIGRHQS